LQLDKVGTPIFQPKQHRRPSTLQYPNGYPKVSDPLLPPESLDSAKLFTDGITVMKPRLLAISGSLAGTIQQVAEARFAIGRDRSNDLALVDPTISFRHCMLQLKGPKFELVDLDSQNGTFINGIPVHRKFIEHGDTIRIGNSELLFLTHESESVATPIRLQPSASASTVTTMRTEHPVALPTFGIEIGSMARDLTALFRISFSKLNSYG
jgi:pSer/pThr/pTyr-binding forkhead associated (FHA) protein